MERSRPRRGTEPNSSDELGFDRDSRASARVLARVVPHALARRAIDVSVATDRDVYERDEPVEITATFENRLPIPVELPTPTQRRWGWTVDGELEASDERRYVRARPATVDFRGGEQKRVSVTWNGRLVRTRHGNQRESVLPEPGEYEIRAFVATREVDGGPSDSTTIAIR
ncbi:hypothetical protein [Natrinema salaciae]|uniref:DUF7974 domain-containing protein n=1 Tax=Natrinema salaciae TaxID=1186196 RepID=A0A1H9J146_9EURY|nr:hypothetical protein [Natrinema salaciae]SEQ80502.1 hypothetical protein SAMN04489841_2403 [Natrinema salaciae]